MPVTPNERRNPPAALEAPAVETLGLEPPDDYQPFRDTVRALIGDGMPSYATSPEGLVRQESLSDQIQAQATPTGTTFYVRWSNIPLGKNVTVMAVPLTIAAYVDGATIPATIANSGVTSDIDQNGNFTLAVAPVASLLVTYGWQAFSDDGIDELLDNARAWLQGFATIEKVPDGLSAALTWQAAALACQKLARKMALPDVAAGEAKEGLSDVAKQYAADAANYFKAAAQARKDFWTTGDQPLQPQAAIVSLNYPAYQPTR